VKGLLVGLDLPRDEELGANSPVAVLDRITTAGPTARPVEVGQPEVSGCWS
jgi:hypothetical protein